MKHVFIVNPISGGGTSNKLIPFIKEYCENNGINYEMFISSKPHETTEIANRYSIKDDVCIYAVGGDGTAYEVINGINDRVPIAIIPSGTGNDYFRMILDDNSDLKKIIIDTINGHNVQVDYGVSNNCRFLNCTSFGLDAAVNEMVCKTIKKTPIPKSMAYGLSACSNIIAPKKFDLHLETENQIIQTRAYLVAIMNGKYYGNGVSPIDESNIQDGLFNICIVGDIPHYKLPFLLPKYLKGNAKNIKKDIYFLQGSHIKVYCDSKVSVQSDGELFNNDQMVFDLMKNGVTLRVPTYSKLK